MVFFQLIITAKLDDGNNKLEYLRNALRRLFSQTVRVLSRKTGVPSAEFSFAEELASLEYESALITVDQLQQAVEKAGFEIAAA